MGKEGTTYADTWNDVTGTLLAPFILARFFSFLDAHSLSDSDLPLGADDGCRGPSPPYRQ